MAIRITLRGWSRALAALAAAALARDGGDEARFPVCSLAAALAGTVALVGWLAWSGLARDRSSDAVTAQVVRTAELRGVLAHLDEVLTMSARMAAVTGDPRWRERYDLFVPRLDRAIADAMELSPPAGRRRIDEAINLSSHALLSLEEAALEAVSTGGPGANAAVLLDGEGYEDRHKGAYAQGLAALTGHMNALLTARREAVSRSAARDATIALLGGLAIAGAWAHVAAVLRRWRRTLTAGEEARFRRLSDAALEQG